MSQQRRWRRRGGGVRGGGGGGGAWDLARAMASKTARVFGALLSGSAQCTTKQLACCPAG
uniref:Uncharacterized protein n=1 Tax=Arundo donax TaxID=35708 RepID=A0A0A8YTP5_ARUDO